MAFFKDLPVRNKKYTDWVKSLECCVCGAPADDPHHGIALGYGEGGTGTKACDLLTMPMCRPCHNEIHQPESNKEDQWRYIAKTLQRAIKDGVIQRLMAQESAD
jgi:hypothetical protein